MPPSAPPRNDQLASDSIKAKWLARNKRHFFELRKAAFQWPPVSPTFCFTGVDPKSIYEITYGRTSELDNTLHDIYIEYGPVDLQACARDLEGKYYVKCSQPRNKYAPAKAIICVLPADEEKSRTAAKAPPPVSDGEVQDGEIWEDIVFDEVLEDDDWVKV